VNENHHPRTKTVYLAAIYIFKTILYTFLSLCRTRKNYKKDIRKASVELWMAKVPHSTIRGQLKML
jgi:hypothetical protein